MSISTGDLLIVLHAHANNTRRIMNRPIEFGVAFAANSYFETTYRITLWREEDGVVSILFRAGKAPYVTQYRLEYRDQSRESRWIDIANIHGFEALIDFYFPIPTEARLKALEGDMKEVMLHLSLRRQDDY